MGSNKWSQYLRNFPVVISGNSLISKNHISIEVNFTLLSSQQRNPINTVPRPGDSAAASGGEYFLTFFLIDAVRNSRPLLPSLSLKSYTHPAREPVPSEGIIQPRPHRSPNPIQ